MEDFFAYFGETNRVTYRMSFLRDVDQLAHRRGKVGKDRLNGSSRSLAPPFAHFLASERERTAPFSLSYSQHFGFVSGGLEIYNQPALFGPEEKVSDGQR